MILQASNGCFLTQSGEVAFTERRFEKSILVASLSEAASWKEIPEADKVKYEQEANLFEPDELNFEYLQKVDSLVASIADKINEAGLNNDDALSLKKYFPNWVDSIGKYAYAGYRYQVDEVLVEVVTPHELSLDKDPTQQPMMLSLEYTETDSESIEETPIYFKQVIGSNPTTLEE